jgi:hypothetical protein
MPDGGVRWDRKDASSQWNRYLMLLAGLRHCGYVVFIDDLDRLPEYRRRYCVLIAARPPRRMYFWILPVAVLGRSGTKLKHIGTLKCAVH